MTSSEIRQKFLDFFKEKEHQIVASAPLVVKNDPTLMFTNAGMNQFKDFFLGNQTASSPRIADTQKCLRVSGKHNDLEEVGHDTYHHTMFEMLGNWSFGDYFKKEAIEWAWELLTEVYKLDKDLLYVTIFEGDASQGLEKDQEAYDFWKEHIAENRIIEASKHDNFWEMGDTGPCGPCSEIHIDLRSEAERQAIDGKTLVNQDHPQVVEIWNLVFMQFERVWKENGASIYTDFVKSHPKEQFKKEIEAKHIECTELKSLTAQHVDTGMGFERLCMAMQGKKSNYDTDVFQPLIQFIAEKAPRPPKGEKPLLTPPKEGKFLSPPSGDGGLVAMRVISDHIRAVSFAIADGQLPQSDGAGYVIRRILRRAVRYAYTYLDFKTPFIHTLVPLLSEQFAEVFPELKQQEEYVQTVIKAEEESFLKTLETGLKLLDEVITDTKNSNEKAISGKTVFKLYDTFGFPKDLTALVARENNLEIDEKGFETEMQAQKDRARKATSLETGDWVVLNEIERSEFLGYDTLETSTKIARYRKVKIKKKEAYQIVLAETPFYAESGGQVGDKGVLELTTNNQKLTTIPIIDTKKENDLIVHFTPKDDFTKIESLADVEVVTKVKIEKRKLTENNHSATHLLHAALRQVLGNHVAQKGSYLDEKTLRFDFSHPSKMTEEEILEVEQIVNQKIRENIALDEKRNVPFETATKAMGATGLFGEKYGDFVRVITFDENYSRELCGGTHVQATGQIGHFKITSESSVGTGVRRVEAITADYADKFIQEELTLLEDLKSLFKNPKDMRKAVESLLEERNKLSKKIENLENQQTQALKDELLEKITEVNGIHLINRQISLPSVKALKQLAHDLQKETSEKDLENVMIVLACNIEGKPQIGVILSDNLIKEKGLHAGKIIKDLAKEIKGGGGGQDFFATAGGKDVNGLGNVVEKAGEFVESI